MIEYNDSSSGIKTAFIIPISMITFYIINLIVKKIVFSLKNFDENANLWRLKNTSVSWCHSMICSMLVIRR